MAKERARGGFLERTAGFVERLNYALGAVALVGAAVFPEASTPLIAFGALQFAEGAVWKWLKDRRSKGAKPKAAMAAG